MGIVEDKKLSPVVVKHWKKKFDKAICILMQSGIKPEELIEKIKTVENEENNKNQ